MFGRSFTTKTVMMAFLMTFNFSTQEIFDERTILIAMEHIFVLISPDSHYFGYCLPNCHPIFKKRSYGLNRVATALLMVFELFIHYTFDTTIEIVTLECISRCYQTLTILANLLLVTDTQNPESQRMDHQGNSKGVWPLHTLNSWHRKKYLVSLTMALSHYCWFLLFNHLIA